MMRRILPHPILSLCLLILWLCLVNRLALGSLVMASLLATAIPIGIQNYLPNHPKIPRPFLLIPYAALVLWDVVIASIQVAKIIVFMRKDHIQSAFIAVPIGLKSPAAITLLASTITMTPGTLTADISADQRVLLIHCLHAPNPDAVRGDIKSRYEARLKRIFE